MKVEGFTFVYLNLFNEYPLVLFYVFCCRSYLVRRGYKLLIQRLLSFTAVKIQDWAYIIIPHIHLFTDYLCVVLLVPSQECQKDIPL